MTPTQSQLNAWQPGVLADAGAGLNAMAQNLSADARKMFNSVHAMGGNGLWRGVARPPPKLPWKRKRSPHGRW